MTIAQAGTKITCTNEVGVTLTDIAAAAGVTALTKTDTSQFTLIGQIFLVNSSMVWTDEDIYQQHSTSTITEYGIGVDANSTWTVLRCNYTHNFDRSGGSTMIMLSNDSNRGVIDFQDSSFFRVGVSSTFYRAYGGSVADNHIIKRCYIQTGAIGGRIGGTLAQYDENYHIATSTMQIFQGAQSFNDNIVRDSATVFSWNLLNSHDVTIKNLVATGLTTATVAIAPNSSGAGLYEAHFVDFDTEPFTRTLTNNGTSGAGDFGTVYWDYSFNPSYFDLSSGLALENVRMAIFNSSGTELFNKLSDVNGDVTNSEVNHSSVVVTAAPSETTTLHGTFIVKERLYGYTFREFSNEMDKKQESAAFLSVNDFVVANEATAAGYSSKFTVSTGSKLITITSTSTSQELYDYLQYWCAESANVSFDELLSTSDGINVDLLAGWAIKINSGVTFTILNQYLIFTTEHATLDCIDIDGTLTVGISTVLNSVASGIKIDTPPPALHYTGNNGIYIETTGTFNQYGVVETTLPLENNGTWTMEGSILELHGIAGNAVDTSFVNEATGIVNWEDSLLKTDDTTGQYTWRKAPTIFDGMNTQKIQKVFSFSSAAQVNIIAPEYQGTDNGSDCTMWSGTSLSTIIFRDPISKNDLLLKFLGEIDGALDGNSSNAGTITVDFSFNPTIRDGSDNSILQGATYYLTDTDNGNRTTPHSADKEYSDTTDVLGKFTNQFIQERIRYKAYASGAGYPVADIREPYNGWVRAYGFNSFNLNGLTLSQAYTLDLSLPINIFVSATEIVASAYTGITVNGVLKTVTVSESRTTQETYDYLQWWQKEIGNNKYNEPLSTADGNNYSLASGWKIILLAEISGGINLTGDVELSSVVNLTSHNINGRLTFTVAGTYVITDSTITEVENTSGGNVIINAVNSTFTTNLSPGTLTINTTSPIKIAVIDESTELPNTQARVHMIAGAGGTLTQGDIIIDAQLVDGGGEVNTTVNAVNQPFTGLVVDALNPSLYIPKPISGTIGNSLDLTVGLVLDE